MRSKIEDQWHKGHITERKWCKSCKAQSIRCLVITVGRVAVPHTGTQPACSLQVHQAPLSLGSKMQTDMYYLATSHYFPWNMVIVRCRSHRGMDFVRPKTVIGDGHVPCSFARWIKLLKKRLYLPMTMAIISSVINHCVSLFVFATYSYCPLNGDLGNDKLSVD